MKNIADFTKDEIVTIKSDLRAKALVDLRKYATEIDKLRKQLIFAHAQYDYACRIYEAADREYNAAREAAREGGAR